MLLFALLQECRWRPQTVRVDDARQSQLRVRQNGKTHPAAELKQLAQPRVGERAGRDAADFEAVQVGGLGALRLVLLRRRCAFSERMLLLLVVVLEQQRRQRWRRRREERMRAAAKLLILLQLAGLLHQEQLLLVVEQPGREQAVASCCRCFCRRRCCCCCCRVARSPPQIQRGGVPHGRKRHYRVYRRLYFYVLEASR